MIKNTLIIKTLIEVGIELYLALFDNGYSNITFNDEMLRAFLLKSEVRQGCLLLLIVFKLSTMKIRKIHKSFKNWKVKLFTFPDKIIV